MGYSKNSVERVIEAAICMIASLQQKEYMKSLLIILKVVCLLKEKKMKFSNFSPAQIQEVEVLDFISSG